MKNTTLMANRFREVLFDGKWIAFTNYKELLSDLTWQQATTKISSLNTIAALTFHINYYIAGVSDFLEGQPLSIRDKYSFDLPPITSQEDWEKLRAELFLNAERFAQHLEALPDKKLDTVFIDEKYGHYRRNMEGMIEHAYYHMGQITLIKKMVLAL